MNLLTDEEIDALWLPDGITKPQMIVRRAIVRAAEKAILARLAAKELPEPATWGLKDFVTRSEKPLFTADQLHEAHAQGFAAGAAAQLADKPSAWSFKQNRVHSCLQFFCPPDEAYDEGTLIELYTRRGS